MYASRLGLGHSRPVRSFVYCQPHEPDYFENDWTDFAANWRNWSVGARRWIDKLEVKGQRSHKAKIGQTCDQNILKTDVPILLKLGRNGPQGTGTKQSTFGINRSKVKVTTLPKRDLEMWQRQQSQPLESSRFSSLRCYCWQTSIYSLHNICNYL